MAQLLALEWNGQEIRAAVASARGVRVVVEHALCIAADGQGAEGETAEQRIGRQIAEGLDARGVGRPPTLVAVGRASVELRRLQFPPTPDDELPDMVRFQAAREFNEFDENWLLDFVPLEGSETSPRTVLATAIAPAVIRSIEAVCQAAGLKMQRLVLRPCAAASLVTDKDPESQGKLRLLVNLFPDEADLTIVLDGKAVFLRTTRIGAGASPLGALVSEIRLTMAAVHSQMPGCKVESIVLCGDGLPQEELTQSIEGRFGIPVTRLDPFSGVEVSSALHGAMPDQTGRFAPLVGMLAAEARQSGHAVDFLNPRRRPPPPNRRKTWVIAASAALVLGLAWLIYARVENFLLYSEWQRLSSASDSMERKIADGKKVRKTVAEIAKWADSEAIWLEQLRALSEGFPPAEDAVLGQLTFGVNQSGSRVDLKGWVRNAEIIAKMEERARQRVGQLTGNSSREDNSVKNYSCRFEASLLQAKGGKP